MRVKTFSSVGPQYDFGEMQWDAAFLGEELDDRCKEARLLTKTRARVSYGVSYSDAQPHRLCIDSALKAHPQLVAAFKGYASVVFETTSLGTVEILLLLRAAKEAGLKQLDCVYVEPLEYEQDTYLETSWSREFSLSDGHKVTGVPGFLSTLSNLENQPVKLVTFLGYESSRLASASQQLDMDLWTKYAIVGVPGFATGWEINTLANNIDALDAQAYQSIRYCAASSVSGALDSLRKIHSEGHRDAPHTVVAPMGTKPHGIAAAIFLVQHSKYQASSLLYDHPRRSQRRTRQIRRWHLYRIDLQVD